MSQLIKRNSSVVFVSITMPALSQMAFENEPEITIVRDAVAVKAGEKQLVIECENTNSARQYIPTSYTFTQSSVNTLEVPEYLNSNPFTDCMFIVGRAVFTTDNSDEVIRKKAQQWCKEILDIYTNTINNISQNLSEAVDKSESPDTLFNEEPQAA